MNRRTLHSLALGCLVICSPQLHAQVQLSPETPAPAAFVEIVLAPGVRAVAFEWIMIVNAAERAHLAVEAPELLAYLSASAPLSLDGGIELLTFTVPPDLDSESAILALVPESLRHRIDRNHLYETEDSAASR